MVDKTQPAKTRIRRECSAQFKAQVLAQCAAPGALVSEVAKAHGLNTNLVYTWRKLARQQGARPLAQPAAQPLAAPAFVPLVIEAIAPDQGTPAPLPAQHIDIQVRRGQVSMTLSWPLSATAELTSWMRELLR